MSTLRARAVTADDWGKPVLNDAGEPICRWCRGAVVRPRRTFCSDACVHEWKIRSSPWYVRQQVKKRDKGTCRLCGFNVVKAHREWTRSKPPAGDRAARKAWRALKPRWEADHIVPVADGGGECGLENYRLLCRACHVSVTSQWRQARRVVRLTASATATASPPKRFARRRKADTTEPDSSPRSVNRWAPLPVKAIIGSSTHAVSDERCDGGSGLPGRRAGGERAGDGHRDPRAGSHGDQT